jgi:hypothetical protein
MAQTRNWRSLANKYFESLHYQKRPTLRQIAFAWQLNWQGKMIRRKVFPDDAGR